MAFSGKYEVESQENYESFMKLIGIPEAQIEKGKNFKYTTEVVQNGNEFTWSQIYPGHTTTNKFVVGQESDMQTMGGKQFKTTVKWEGDKIAVDFPNYHHTSEIVGGKLVETSVSGGITFKRVSKKLICRLMNKIRDKKILDKKIYYNICDDVHPKVCACSSNITMAFSGKYEVESQENYDAFMKLIGIPEEQIEKGRNYNYTAEVVQNGNDFTWSQIYPGFTLTNKFTVGQESDLETMGGKKFKATVRQEGGKLVVDFPKYSHSSEIVGGKLVETSVAGGLTFKRISKKVA
ncbi:uncharacterized protein ACNLHF_016645 [Anomaloglossus baeobatrachus]